MPKFTVVCRDPVSGEIKNVIYDNELSTLTDENGKDFVPSTNKEFPEAFRVSKDNPAGKSHALKTIKISLGLSCNYECEYCSQRFVPHEGETNQKDIQPFLDQLPAWFDGGDDGFGAGVKLEFWGGEPLVYWKTLKPLAEHLRLKYPNITMYMITNGSLLDFEKNEWLDRIGFSVSISHDAVGQHVRGPDPLDDPQVKEAILDLYNRLHPKARFSFNTMIHKGNQSRNAVVEFFQKLTGNEAYDEGGLSTSLNSYGDAIAYRNLALTEGRLGKLMHLMVPKQKTVGFVDSIKNRRPASALGQKCGMDRPDQIAVDLTGKVITCQNVSAIATAPNGGSHTLGDVSDYNNVKLTTATHWAHREDCTNCPVLQLCQGSCMFLQGKHWEASCENSFSDNIVYFALGIEHLTGLVPFYIDGPQRDDRKDIFGLVHGIPERKAKKPFPIPVVSA